MGDWLGVLFFQAEDGIRDLVRSRGLGDVYKRQALVDVGDRLAQVAAEGGEVVEDGFSVGVLHGVDSVSYTHLTLPTSDLV